MPVAAIGPAIGLGASLFSGISGKNAAKKQQQMAQAQMAQMQPFIDQQLATGKFALNTSQDFFNHSKPYIQGAGQAVHDLQNFWNPLLQGNINATQAHLAPEIGAVNKGYNAFTNTLAKQAPRGPGRITALMNANVQRQGQLNDLIFGSRKEAASQMGNLAGQLKDLGLGTAQVAGSTLGAGMGAGKDLMSLLMGQQDRAFTAQNQAAGSLGSLGSSLGGFINSIFKGNKGGAKGGSKGADTTPGINNATGDGGWA